MTKTSSPQTQRSKPSLPTTISGARNRQFARPASPPKRKPKRRAKPKTQLARWTKSDFRPREIELWVAYNNASNECMKFTYSRVEQAGLSKEVIETVVDSLRAKEMVTLNRLDAALKKRRLDPLLAGRRLRQLQPTLPVRRTKSAGEPSK